MEGFRHKCLRIKKSTYLCTQVSNTCSQKNNDEKILFPFGNGPAAGSLRHGRETSEIVGDTGACPACRSDKRVAIDGPADGDGARGLHRTGHARSGSRGAVRPNRRYRRVICLGSIPAGTVLSTNYTNVNSGVVNGPIVTNMTLASFYSDYGDSGGIVYTYISPTNTRYTVGVLRGRLGDDHYKTVFTKAGILLSIFGVERY